MSAGALFIGYKRCRVLDVIDISICYRCGRANHSHKKCNNDIKCLICAGDHDTKVCKNPIKKCVNCFYYNSKFNKTNCVDHVATDTNACEYLKYKINTCIKMTDYPSQPHLPKYLGKPLEPKMAVA